MTNEQLLKYLDAINPYLVDNGMDVGHPIRQALREAMRRIATETDVAKVEASEPPEGSVEVRIAVAVNARGDGDAWVVSPGRESDEYCLVRVRDGNKTAEAIITAHIPPREVPVVLGTVVDLESTK